MPPQCGAFSRDLQDKSRSPRYSPGVGGPWLQMTSALDVVLRTGHVEPSTGWISEVRKLNVVAQKRSSRPRKSWDEVIKNDRKKARYGLC